MSEQQRGGLLGNLKMKKVVVTIRRHGRLLIHEEPLHWAQYHAIAGGSIFLLSKRISLAVVRIVFVATSVGGDLVDGQEGQDCGCEN